MSDKQYKYFSRIVRSHLRRVRKDIFLAAFCILGTTLTAVITPWPMKLLFDHVLLQKHLPTHLSFAEGTLYHGSISAVLLLCAAIVVIAFFKGFFAYYQFFLMSRIGFLFVYTLRGELFDHLQRLSLSFHNRAHSGELLSKLTSDTNTLKDTYADSAVTFVTHVLTMLGMFVIMFLVNAKLTLIVAASFPVLFIAIFYVVRRVKFSARRQRQKEGELASRVSEFLASIRLVQAYGMEQYERDRFNIDSAQSMEEGVRTARMAAAATRSVEIISAIGTGTVILFGCLQVFAGAMTPGDILVFASYITQMYEPIRQISKLSTRFSRASVSIERLNEILDIEPEFQDRPDAIAASNLRGSIAFDHVSFAYEDGRSILNNVSFKIRPGQRVALVGASGAGKSTVANLIMRFYEPQQGAVYIDQVNVNQYQRSSLRQEIGVVLQDSILFGTTIRENIAYGRPEATLEEIEEAARQVHAHDFIAVLPNGYETVLTESGSTLSGGQRQRLCLARAMIRRSSILVLDEPTSAVDAESQALIRDAMDRLHTDKTLLLIAHQFHMIQDFDLILVLNNGSIVEQGKHDELMRLKGHYYDLCRSQSNLRAA